MFILSFIVTTNVFFPVHVFQLLWCLWVVNDPTWTTVAFFSTTWSVNSFRYPFIVVCKCSIPVHMYHYFEFRVIAMQITKKGQLRRIRIFLLEMNECLTLLLLKTGQSVYTFCLKKRTIIPMFLPHHILVFFFVSTI